LDHHEDDGAKLREQRLSLCALRREEIEKFDCLFCLCAEKKLYLLTAVVSSTAVLHQPSFIHLIAAGSAPKCSWQQEHAYALCQKMTD